MLAQDIHSGVCFFNGYADSYGLRGEGGGRRHDKKGYRETCIMVQQMQNLVNNSVVIPQLFFFCERKESFKSIGRGRCGGFFAVGYFKFCKNANDSHQKGTAVSDKDCAGSNKSNFEVFPLI